MSYWFLSRSLHCLQLGACVELAYRQPSVGKNKLCTGPRALFWHFLRRWCCEVPSWWDAQLLANSFSLDPSYASQQRTGPRIGDLVSASQRAQWKPRHRYRAVAVALDTEAHKAWTSVKAQRARERERERDRHGESKRTKGRKKKP